VRDARIPTEGGEVDLLRGAAGAEFQESGEGVQVTDVDHVPDVALDIGGGVVGEPLVCRDIAVVDPRVGALPQELIERVGGGGEGAQLVEAGG
jgi:hypothetical protein